MTLTPIRAAEAMRDAAANAVCADVDLLRRQGHREAADAYEHAVRRIRAITPESVLNAQPTPDEFAAFEAAAQSTSFNLSRGDNGEYVYAITQRVFSVWRAAVRWARESDQSQ